MRKLVVSVLVAVAALGSSFVMPPPLEAHTTLLYYPFWWKGDVSVEWAWSDHDFDNGGAAGAAARTAITNGAAQWNNQGEPMQFVQNGFNYSYTEDSCNAATLPLSGPVTYPNALFWSPLPDPDMLGEIRACVYTTDDTRFYSFRMVFDSDRTDWYKGTGTPGLLQYDLWSVASHEFGHAVGHWYHWDEPYPSDLCLGTSLHTMCSTASLLGNGAERSLEVHDRHTFTPAY